MPFGRKAGGYRPTCGTGSSDMPWMSAPLQALLFLGALAGARPLASQEMAVPVSVQVPLMVKVLGFDRALVDRPSGRVMVGILYQGRHRVSARAADEVREALFADESGVGGLPIGVVLIDLDHAGDVGDALASAQVNVLYVAPLRAVAVSHLAASTATRGITTMTGVPRYVEEGLVMGIDLRADRPQIVINVAAARAAGARFSSQLLKLARLTGEGVAAR